MISVAWSLLIALSFMIFILLATAIAFLLGIASAGFVAGIVVVVLCAVALLFAVFICLKALLIIETAVHRLRSYRRSDPMAEPHGDVTKIPVR